MNERIYVNMCARKYIRMCVRICRDGSVGR
jgi:hypothetical protein